MRHRIRPGQPPKVRLNKAGKPRERFEGLRDEPYREWVRDLDCCIAGRTGVGGTRHSCWSPEHRCDAAHVSTKAKGTGDAGQLVPMCRRAHQDQHDYGIRSFQAEWGVNLREIAGALWIRYERERGAPTL